uniref:RRM domain-containing protein n=1 Tax=Onchocerca volvulus TaxID=6282 RepID=A0A8R1XLN6_ONCVO
MLTTFGEKTKKLDTDRVVIINTLPMQLQHEPQEQFNETIFRLINLKFNLNNDVIDRIIRFPLISDDADQELGVKCLVSFCSRVHRDRVISLKNRLDPPTTVDPITEPPKELSGEAEFETVAAPANLEMAGERNSDPADTVAVDADSGAQSALSTGVPNIPVAPVASTQSDIVVACDDDDALKLIVGKNCKNENIEEETGNVTQETDAEVVLTVVESLKNITVRSLGEETGPDKLTNKMIMAEYYKTLPIDWDGAPEFQWRLCKDESDRRLVIFENVLPADMRNPWFYTALLRCKRVIMDFPLSAGKIDADFNHLYGRIEAYFQSDHPIAYCAVNNLVHIRTGAHRVKIYLPQTKWVRKYKDILESRLGRMREPMESMRYLIVKPISNEVTEKQIRETCFKNYPIESVRFERDVLGQLMAVLLFPTAREAVAAHSNNDFIHLGARNVSSNYIKVYFPNVDFHGWDRLIVPTPETDMYCLLTYKEFISYTQSKKIEQEQEKLSKTSVAMEMKQTRNDTAKMAQDRKLALETERKKDIIENGGGNNTDINATRCCESIKPAEKNVGVRNLQSKPTFPKKSQSSGDAKRIVEDDGGGPSRKRRRTGRYRRRRFSRSDSFRSIPSYSMPPAPPRYGGSYRVEPWRRPLQPAPYPYSPVFDSYGYADARRRKPPGKLPVMDVAVADVAPPPPLSALPLSGILERRKEMDLQEHIFRQQQVIDDLAKKLSTQNAAPDYTRHAEMNDPYAVMQAPSTSSFPAASTTSKMPAWVTPSIYTQSQGGSSAETYEAWR